jgi:predicted acetyltransferase
VNAIRRTEEEDHRNWDKKWPELVRDRGYGREIMALIYCHHTRKWDALVLEKCRIRRTKRSASWQGQSVP